MEVSLSFDNAVVNAKVLERMSDFWQKIFLTIGILIAVFSLGLFVYARVVRTMGHFSGLAGSIALTETKRTDSPSSWSEAWIRSNVQSTKAIFC